MFTVIAVIIFAMMCSIIHTFFWDFQMMESAFVWCIYLITDLSTTDITECCGECWLFIWYPVILWWAIKVTFLIRIPEISWFCSLLYNHRIFSLSTHNTTEKNLWLLTWMFLHVQLPCFKQWVWQHMKKQFSFCQHLYYSLGQILCTQFACLSSMLQLVHMPLHLHGRLHYKNSFSITEVLLTVHHIFKLIFYSIFQPLSSHMPQPLVPVFARLDVSLTNDSHIISVCYFPCVLFH